MSILDRIDDTLADRCACGCGSPCGDSAWYASEDCQHRVLSAQTTDPEQVYNRPDDLSALAEAVEDTPPAEYLLAILADQSADPPASETTDRCGQYPCRVVPTRNCPVVYGGVCGHRPCARFESEDEAVWLCNPAEYAQALIDDAYDRLARACRDAEDRWLR